eukprot:50512-Lingulodinium_polyedra.AAC.1
MAKPPGPAEAARGGAGARAPLARGGLWPAGDRSPFRRTLRRLRSGLLVARRWAFAGAPS